MRTSGSPAGRGRRHGRHFSWDRSEQVMNRALLALAAAACVLAAACGKSSPSTPAPTVSTLSLSPGTDWVKIKATEKFTATAVYTSGASEAVSPTWTSDNSAILTVDGSGTVTGVAAGQATV